MGKKRFIAVLSLTWLFLTACVSNQQLQDQNVLLNTELKHAQIELYKAEEKGCGRVDYRGRVEEIV